MVFFEKYHKIIDDTDNEKIVVWDNTMKIYVIKYRSDVKLLTWKNGWYKWTFGKWTHD